jgi:gluconolactonase
MTVEIRDDRFRHIILDSAELTRLETGFYFTEGPIWNHVEKHLTFSDMPGDHMRRWTADGGITTFRKPCNKANGNAYDRSGRIVTCEHATSRVTRTETDGSIIVLASHYQGKELNSPNDVVVKSSGDIYFTDPTLYVR